MIETLRHLSFLMDSAFQFPGTKFRFGFDGLLGLVPGVGSVVSYAFSIYIIVQAYRIGTPWKLLARMALNVTLDMLIGSIPIVGNVFDFLFKANQRNLRIMGVPPEEPV